VRPHAGSGAGTAFGSRHPSGNVARVTTSPVIEAGESSQGNWLRGRRLRIALLIGLVESLLVVWGGLGWFWVLAFAAVAVALYIFVARGGRFHALREIAWILAASQLIAVLVPVLWEVAKTLAIVILVLMAALLLVTLLMDRR
jgi:hypothetical protein